MMRSIERSAARMRWTIAALALVAAPWLAGAQGVSETGLAWPDPIKMRGSVFVGGGGELSEAQRARFTELAGGDEAKIVVVSLSSAGGEAGRPEASDNVKIYDPSAGGLAAMLAEATGVWLAGEGDLDRLDALRTQNLGEHLAAVIERGGAVGANGRAAHAMTAMMIAGGERQAELGEGFDVLSQSVIQTGFGSDANAEGRLLGVLAAHPGHVGIGVDEGTVMIVDGFSRTLRGRGVQVAGLGNVTMLLAGNEFKPIRKQVLSEPRANPNTRGGRGRGQRGQRAGAGRRGRGQRGQRAGAGRRGRGQRAGQGRGGRGQRRGGQRGGGQPQAPAETLRGGRPAADLTAWRRDALERTVPAKYPADELPVPYVESGTLVIVGGGGMPSGLWERMIEMAGGDASQWVYVPCEERDVIANEPGTVRSILNRGAASATFIHTKDRAMANGDESILGPLREATGLWFGGGRQWNFVDSYHDTKAMELMQDVLARGGVIGGSSAGASIQGRWLARSDPLGNANILAPGYERGLGFIEGVAIDQHFRQRTRFPNMTELADHYPQILGIGLDEATAIIVSKSTADVVGRGEAHFYNRRVPKVPGEPDHVSLGVGGRYDLANREVLDWGSGRTRLTGDWALVTEMGGGTSRRRMRIEEDLVDGEHYTATDSLRGTYQIEDRRLDLEDLRISEGSVTFGLTLEIGGEELAVVFEGTLDGDSLTGEFTSEQLEGEVVATVRGRKIGA